MPATIVRIGYIMGVLSVMRLKDRSIFISRPFLAARHRPLVHRCLSLATHAKPSFGGKLSWLRSRQVERVLHHGGLLLSSGEGFERANHVRVSGFPEKLVEKIL